MGGYKDTDMGMNIRINAKRLLESLDQMAAVGATPNGGVTRLALSDEDRQARDLLRRWMEEAGLTVRVDDVGNMTGRRAGRQDGPALLLGSHLDSVRRGGRLDGPLGVLGGLEVVRTLNDLGLETERPIEVVNFTDEEGARFEPAMLCSGAVAGHFDQEYVYSRTDQEGIRFGDELRRIGYQGRVEDRPGPAYAFLELHVEQNPELEEAGVPVGVVEGINTITWMTVTVEGESNNGPTPMAHRRDALQAAARMISALDEIVRDFGLGAVGGVGRIRVEPNVINQVPARVIFSVDIRHPELAVVDTLVEGFSARAREVAAERRVGVEIDRFWTSEPTPFDPLVVNAVEAACQEIGVPHQRIWSGSGHDAKYMAALCPTGMIFTRSKDGLSHREDEYSSPEDIEASVNVLLLAAARLAGVVERD